YCNKICRQSRHRMKWMAAIKRLLLQGPAWVYELAVRLRIAAYETGYLKPERVKAAVVSIGNITLGGTGKTPLTQYIACYLSEEGYSVAVLSRGYGRISTGQLVLNAPKADAGQPLDSPGQPLDSPVELRWSATGDEPLLLARSLPHVPVVINKD